MKTINVTRTVDIPEGVEITVEARTVTVKGPRGSLTRSFRTDRNGRCEMKMVGKTKKRLVIDIWFGTKKMIACLRTFCSHIENMIVGVTQGYRYKMRFVYSHFPINVSITDDKKNIEIRNFLGEKRVRVVTLKPGVSYIRSKDVKDQIEIVGSDVENVGQTCSLIRQSCLVKKKDIRKFLDGIYVSEKGSIPVEEFEPMGYGTYFK